MGVEELKPPVKTPVWDGVVSVGFGAEDEGGEEVGADVEVVIESVQAPVLPELTEMR